MAAQTPANKAVAAEAPEAVAPKAAAKPVKLKTPDGRDYLAPASEVDDLVNSRGYVRTK